MQGDQLSLGEVARLTGCSLLGNPDRQIRFLAHPEHAAGADLTFLDARFEPALLRDSRAAVLLPQAMAEALLMKDVIVSPAPQQAFLQVARELWRRHAYPPATVDASALIDPEARIEAGCHIGPHCVVQRGAWIGAGSALHANSVIGSGARIGAGSCIGINVTIGPGTVMGARCVIHAGAVVGFAYSPMRSAQADSQPPNYAPVVMGDDVEIGPNCVVESGEMRPTLISDGVHVGALGMVGHDSHIGRGARLVAMVGLAGESRIGEQALLLGQVGVGSRSSVGDRAVVLAKSGVDRDIPADTIATGIPARSRKEWLPALAALRSLPRLAQRMRALQLRIDSLEEKTK